MQPLDPTDDDAAPGRHRLAPSPGRTLAVRAALVAGCLLGSGALGLVTAETLGLTGFTASAPDHASTPGMSTVLPVGPALERTVDERVGAPQRSTPSPAPAPEPPAEAAPSPEVHPAPAPPPSEPAAAPPPTVEIGDRCPERGATAVTDDGRRVVCAGRGHGPARWRRG